MTTAPSELEGLITDDVGKSLTYWAAKVKPGYAIVEIGSYRGKSTAFLATAAREGVAIYAVDPWETRPIGEWCRWCPSYKQPRIAEFLFALEQAGVRERVTPLMGLSTKIAESYDGPEIGLLFIDGDHSAEACEADFRAWRPHMGKGSLVLFDDYGVTANPGVAEAVDKLENEDAFSVSYEANGRLAVAWMPVR